MAINAGAEVALAVIYVDADHGFPREALRKMLHKGIDARAVTNVKTGGEKMAGVKAYGEPLWLGTCGENPSQVLDAGAEAASLTGGNFKGDLRRPIVALKNPIERGAHARDTLLLARAKVRSWVQDDKRQLKSRTTDKLPQERLTRFLQTVWIRGGKVNEVAGMREDAVIKPVSLARLDIGVNSALLQRLREPLHIIFGENLRYLAANRGGKSHCLVVPAGDRYMSADIRVILGLLRASVCHFQQ